MIKKYLLPSSLILMMGGCVGSTATSTGDVAATSTGDAATNNTNVPDNNQRCLVSDPKDVHMWINSMPGTGTGGRPPVRASFTVTTPTPGYGFALKVDTVMESFPEQVVLDLVVTRPSGMVIQVISETKVNIKLDNFPGSEGSSVQVNCAGKPFFKVDKVLAVH